MGYALTWFTKWALVDLLYNRDLISVALKQVLYRSVGSESFGYLMTISDNIYYLIYFFLIMILGCYIYILIKAFDKANKENKIKPLPYFLISIIPFVWIFLIRDHSFKHAFFTYRNFLLTMLGLPVGIYYLFEKKKKQVN